MNIVIYDRVFTNTNDFDYHECSAITPKLHFKLNAALPYPNFECVLVWAECSSSLIPPIYLYVYHHKPGVPALELYTYRITDNEEWIDMFTYKLSDVSDLWHNVHMNAISLAVMHNIPIVCV